MSTPTPVATSPMTVTPVTPRTAVVSPGLASPPTSKAPTAAELIKELERKRLELEAQIKKLRAESVKSFPATSFPIAATASNSPGISSSSTSSASIPTPKPSLASLPALPTALQKLVGSGLNTPDLGHLCEQGRVFRTTHSPLMIERRRVTKDLLPHVFNADPIKVAAFFAIPETPKRMVLTKTSYHEGYDSNALKQFVCFRHWTRVSPLQAAALSLDNFLVLDLLSHIENDEALRLQAAQQLQEVLNRKEVKVKAENGSVSSASATTISFSSLSEPEMKVKAENKGKVEAEVEADLSLYQGPFKALLKAYDDFIIQCGTLYSARNYTELDRLWGNVGECHRRLPTYGLQEFCDNKPFNPLPLFTTSPHRGVCRYYDNAPLNLDFLGLKTFVGLYKRQGGGIARDRAGGASVAPCAGFDSAAINRLCELRQAELENIIHCLLKPGATITLRAEKSTVVKP